VSEHRITKTLHPDGFVVTDEYHRFHGDQPGLTADMLLGDDPELNNVFADMSSWVDHDEDDPVEDEGA